MVDEESYRKVILAEHTEGQEVAIASRVSLSEDAHGNRESNCNLLAQNEMQRVHVPATVSGPALRIH